MFRWLPGRLRPNDTELRRLYRAWREAGEAYRLHREEFDAFEGARSDVADHLQRALEADESRMSEIESRMAAVTPDSHHGARLQALVLQREFEAAPGRTNGPFANETMALLAQRLTEYVLRRGGW